MDSRRKRKNREDEEEKTPPQIDQDKRMKDADERGERKKREREDYEQQRQFAKKELEEAEKKLMGIEEKRDSAEKKRDKFLDLFIKETDPSVRDLYKQSWDDAETALQNTEASLRTVQSAVEAQQNAVNRLTGLTLPPSPGSSPSSGSSGRPRGKRLRRGVSEAQDSVQEFWNHLEDAKCEENALELKSGTYFLGKEKLGSKLYVRVHYQGLFDRIESFYSQPMRTAFGIIGTPGIGKTYFLYWLLWRLKMMNAPCVVFQTKRSSYLFLNGEPVVRSGGLHIADSFEPYLEREDCWYLVDGIEPTSDCNGHTILATSPKRDNWYQFVQQRDTSGHKLYMPLFSLDETIECQRACFSDIEGGEEGVVERFNKYGGMARAVLQLFVTHEDMDEFDNAVRDCPPDFNVNWLHVLGKKQDTQVVHRVIHIDVTDIEKYEKYEYKLASPYQAARVAEKYWIGQTQKCRDFVRASQRLPMLAQIRGLAFESLAHGLLSEGGEFRARSLETGVERNEQWPKRELKHFGTLEEMTDILAADGYACPTQKNLTAVDSIVRGSANQMTVSLDHPEKADGVKAIMDVTDIDRLVFVVPSDKYKEFGKQRYHPPKKGKKVAKKVKELEQWVLEIPLI